MTILEAKESIGKDCHVFMDESNQVDGPYIRKAFNGTLSRIDEDTEEGVLTFPNGQVTFPICLNELKLGHSTVDVATEQDFEEAKANGEELERGNER